MPPRRRGATGLSAPCSSTTPHDVLELAASNPGRSRVVESWARPSGFTARPACEPSGVTCSGGGKRPTDASPGHHAHRPDISLHAWRMAGDPHCRAAFSDRESKARAIRRLRGAMWSGPAARAISDHSVSGHTVPTPMCPTSVGGDDPGRGRSPPIFFQHRRGFRRPAIDCDVSGAELGRCGFQRSPIGRSSGAEGEANAGGCGPFELSPAHRR